MSLQSKNAVITGSTSGIGLAMARALAKEGVNITLNGLGDAGEIAKLTEALAREFGVKVRYSPANMLDGEAIADTAVALSIGPEIFEVPFAQDLIARQRKNQEKQDKREERKKQATQNR